MSAAGAVRDSWGRRLRDRASSAMSCSARPTTSSGGRRARSRKATLASGAKFDRELALAQHRELVSIYESAGVACTASSPTRPLPYQVFARDSSVTTPSGAVVTQMAQPWRRGEYAEVIRFYQRNEIPIASMITAGSLEGGDV